MLSFLNTVLPHGMEILNIKVEYSNEIRVFCYLRTRGEAIFGAKISGINN